jgi:hypothetical protein
MPTNDTFDSHSGPPNIQPARSVPPLSLPSPCSSHRSMLHPSHGKQPRRRVADEGADAKLACGRRHRASKIRIEAENRDGWPSSAIWVVMVFLADQERDALLLRFPLPDLLCDGVDHGGFAVSVAAPSSQSHLQDGRQRHSGPGTAATRATQAMKASRETRRLPGCGTSYHVPMLIRR